MSSPVQGLGRLRNAVHYTSERLARSAGARKRGRLRHYLLVGGASVLVVRLSQSEKIARCRGDPCGRPVCAPHVATGRPQGSPLQRLHLSPFAMLRPLQVGCRGRPALPPKRTRWTCRKVATAALSIGFPENRENNREFLIFSRSGLLARFCVPIVEWIQQITAIPYFSKNR
jgi:hypothetical protein